MWDISVGKYVGGFFVWFWILMFWYCFFVFGVCVFFGVLCLVVFGGVLRGLVLGFLVFLFFVFMSGVDFVVHRVLYGDGLRFSFGWALFYWCVFGCVFVVFGVVVGFVYWLGCGRGWRGVRFGVCLCLSVCLLFFGGFEDVLWFVLWGGGLPGVDVVWWWVPWCWVLGFWNSVCQVVLLGVVFVVVGVFWVRILNS